MTGAGGKLDIDSHREEIRRLMAEAPDEPTYCEFKEIPSYADKKEKGEVVKDVSSFANADLEALGGYGSIVFGLSNDGRIVGIVNSHKSPPIREWLAAHPRVEQVFIPKGAAWLNLKEAWWRMFRREALAGQHFANDEEIELATRVATRHLNHRAKPWVWGRASPPPRYRRRTFVYRL